MHGREMAMLKKLRDGNSGLKRIELYSSEDISRHVALLTCNVKGVDPVDARAILDGDFGIAVRVGLHCAPLVHEATGSYPEGSIRFSIGPFNRMEDIDRTIEAMAEIARSGLCQVS